MVMIADGGATRSPDGATSGAATVAADATSLADLARLLAFAGLAALTTAGTSSAAACRFRGGRRYQYCVATMVMHAACRRCSLLKGPLVAARKNRNDRASGRNVDEASFMT